MHFMQCSLLVVFVFARSAYFEFHVQQVPKRFDQNEIRFINFSVNSAVPILV